MSIARITPIIGSLYALLRNKLGLNVAAPLGAQELSVTSAPDRRLVVLGHTPIAGFEQCFEVADEAAMLALHTLDSTTLLAAPAFVAPGDSCLRADDPGWRWHCISGHGQALSDWERRPLAGALAVPAAAGTLTGSTLASGVTSSSLTSAAGGTFGTAAFTDASAYDPAGAAAAITLSGLGGVPTTRTVNGHTLSGNVSVTASDIGLSAVENTALSTWTGSSNLSTVGTILSGTWTGTAIADTYIASAASWNAKVSFPGFGTTGTTACVGNDSRLSNARTPLAHTQAWSTITSTPTTRSGYGITDAQPLDAGLTALAGLSTTGLFARTGAGTAATRTITGTANQITVTNGDGVAGNPTLSLPQNISPTSFPTFGRLIIANPSSSYRTIRYHNGTVPRWEMVVNDLAPYQEAGGNSGSNFNLIAYNDSGSYLSTPITVKRATGDLGVGTGEPTAKLHVAGGNVRFSNYGAGTLVTDSSGNITASSDARLKNVTGSFQRGLADVLKLMPRTYHWNEKSGMDTEDENVGFIAQEVLEAIPEAVGQYRTSEVEVDGKKTKKRGKAELLTLSDRPLIAALVNAVRELNEKNAALEARVAALENRKASK